MQRLGPSGSSCIERNDKLAALAEGETEGNVLLKGNRSDHSTYEHAESIPRATFGKQHTAGGQVGVWIVERTYNVAVEVELDVVHDEADGTELLTDKRIKRDQRDCHCGLTNERDFPYSKRV